MKTPKSVIDLICAADLVALLLVHREIVPRIAHALLHAERNAATVFVDLENHDFDFVAQLHDLGRMNVLVGPVHFGDVHQTFDTLLDFDERTVVGELVTLPNRRVPCG